MQALLRTQCSDYTWSAFSSVGLPAAAGKGLEFVDAPVSGGVARAAAGTLTVSRHGCVLC